METFEMEDSWDRKEIDRKEPVSIMLQAVFFLFPQDGGHLLYWDGDVERLFLLLKMSSNVAGKNHPFLAGKDERERPSPWPVFRRLWA